MLLVGIVIAWGLSALAPVKYTATSTAFVTVAEGGGPTSGEIFQGSQFAVQRVKSYASLVESPQVLDPVIADLDLNLSTRELARKTELTSPPDTVLMDVSVVDGDADRASEIANAVTLRLGEVIEDIETVGGPRRGSNVKVSVTKPAPVPSQPSSPRTLLNLALGAVLGLAIGVLAAVLRHRFDRRVKSADDLRSLTGMSPLGVTTANASWKANPLVALDWRSQAAESYRTIRTALKFAAIDKGIRQIVVSSPGMSDGKTTTACNLAISWAQSGASVCLVEADLRRPKVATYLGIEGNPGLSDVLVDETELDDVLIAWNRGMLTVLPAGSQPPDPGALLGSDAMQTLVESLTERFDVVIYDSPPLLPVTDAVVLGKHLDGLLLTVRHGSTTRDQLSDCAEIASNARVPLLGSVLTCVRTRTSGEHTYGADTSIERPELAPLSSEPKRVTTATTTTEESDRIHSV